MEPIMIDTFSDVSFGHSILIFLQVRYVQIETDAEIWSFWGDWTLITYVLIKYQEMEWPLQAKSRGKKSRQILVC